MERVSRQSGGGYRPSRTRSNDAKGAPIVARPGPRGVDPMLFLARSTEGHGADALRHEFVRNLQRTQGNRATARLLEAQSGAAIPPPIAGGAGIAIARDRRTSVKVSGGRLAAEGKQRRAGALADIRSRSRERRLNESRVKAHEFPSLEFRIADEEVGLNERHRIFVGVVEGGHALMIASYPMKVATFIHEMRARFDELVNEANQGIKKPRGLAATIRTFIQAEIDANTQLNNANVVFANALSGDDQKLAAEQQLAISLDPVIRQVTRFASRLGQHFSDAGNAPMPIVNKIKSVLTGFPDPSYYSSQLQGSAKRYNIEGMVAKYIELPDYEASGFERDHQPHNDLIETMAALPEFAGKTLRTVAAGRTLQGWAIMLHHDRHVAGRTHNVKGQLVTAQFVQDLQNERLRLGAGATPPAIRQFCIDYLVQSMKDDVAAMKLVIADDNRYGDMAGLGAAKAKYMARVKAQATAGEDRILTTEASIRTYDQ